MSTVRQRYQPIALADILLDQRQFHLRGRHRVTSPQTRSHPHPYRHDRSQVPQRPAEYLFGRDSHHPCLPPGHDPVYVRILFQLPSYGRRHPFDPGIRRGFSSSSRPPSTERNHENRLSAVFKHLAAAYTPKHIQRSCSLWLSIIRRGYHFILSHGYAVTPI